MKQEKATKQVVEHIDRARDALNDFLEEAINDDGILSRPQFQSAALKVAREELAKAIAIIDRTTWKRASE